MGNTQTKEQKLKVPEVKPGDIQIKAVGSFELPKIDTSQFAVPKPAVAKTRIQEKYEAEEAARAALIPFSLAKQYDQETYLGRFMCNLERNNPLLFFTTHSDIKEARDLVYKQKLREEAALKLNAGEVRLTAEEIEALRKADKIVGGAVHPDTNEIIPFYMKLSAFVPFNIPILLLTLFVKNQTPLFNVGVQWLNQTYNAGMNYGNRNASSALTTSDLASGYCTAVAVSCSIVFASRMLLASRLQGLTGSKQVIANAALNYFACAIAGASNCALMRQKELKDGIKIQDSTGENTYGQSRNAAFKAVQETAFSRMVLPLPVLFLPAFANYALEAVNMFPKNVLAAKALEVALCTASLSVALPMSIALFKQRSSMSVEDLEVEFQNLKSEKTNDQIREVFFNKGM